MRAFFLCFPKIDALRRELSWTHYRLLLRVEKQEARAFYEAEDEPHFPHSRRGVGIGPYGFRLVERAYSSERPEAAFPLPHSVISRETIIIEFGNLIIYSLLNEDHLCLI